MLTLIFLGQPGAPAQSQEAGAGQPGPAGDAGPPGLVLKLYP